MATNKNKVPVKQWKKWSDQAKSVFNRLYSFMMSNREVMLHPKSPQPSPQHFKTIAWNASWIAADAVDDTIPDKIITR